MGDVVDRADGTNETDMAKIALRMNVRLCHKE